MPIVSWIRCVWSFSYGNVVFLKIIPDFFAEEIRLWLRIYSGTWMACLFRVNLAVSLLIIVHPWELRHPNSLFTHEYHGRGFLRGPPAGVVGADNRSRVWREASFGLEGYFRQSSRKGSDAVLIMPAGYDTMLHV